MKGRQSRVTVHLHDPPFQMNRPRWRNTTQDVIHSYKSILSEHWNVFGAALIGGAPLVHPTWPGQGNVPHRSARHYSELCSKLISSTVAVETLYIIPTCHRSLSASILVFRKSNPIYRSWTFVGIMHTEKPKCNLWESVKELQLFCKRMDRLKHIFAFRKLSFCWKVSRLDNRLMEAVQ